MQGTDQLFPSGISLILTPTPHKPSFIQSEFEVRSSFTVGHEPLCCINIWNVCLIY